MIKVFNRFELKYVIQASQYLDLVADLAHFMVPDKYGDPGGFYRIVSLYYDSPDFSAYHSKLDGLRFRRKLRIRIYVGPGQTISQIEEGFVEIKQRFNRTTQKKRIMLPLEVASRLCAGDAVPECTETGDIATASEISYMVKAMRLKPRAIVSYRRRAFIGGRYESGMRLTFDMQLEGRTHALEVNQNARNLRILPLDWMVMEVKVNERVPRWMVALLAKHQCNLQRVSKYCAALSAGIARTNQALTHRGNIYG